MKAITEFITGPVYYDENGQMIFIKDPNGDQMLADVRGWGHIQYMFKDQREAMDFQDKIGQFIVDAINEKLERDKNLKSDDNQKTSL